MKKRNSIEINFRDVYNSHRINPIQNEYVRTFEDAIAVASQLVEPVFGKNMKDDYIKKMAENFIAACILFLQNYQVKPYDRKGNELHESVTFDENNSEAHYTYTDNDGKQADLYCKRGKFATLPHLFTFLMGEIVLVIDCLKTDIKAGHLVNPIYIALKDRNLGQVEKILGPIRNFTARMMTPEIFWILSGNDFCWLPDDCDNSTSLIVLGEEDGWGGIDALNGLLRHVFKDKAEIRLKTEKKRFFHKWRMERISVQPKPFLYDSEFYVKWMVDDNFHKIIHETDKMVNKVLDIDDESEEMVTEETGCYGEDDLKEIFEVIEQKEPVEEEIEVETAPQFIPFGVDWVDFGNTSFFNNYKIIRGGVYVYSGEWENIKDFSVAPFVMSENMEILSEKEEYGDFTGYFDMTPDMRYDYLQWLSGEYTMEELMPSLFEYYLHGICYRLFMDCADTERGRILEAVGNIMKECISRSDELKKERDIVCLQMDKFNNEEFRLNYTLYKWPEQAKPEALEKMQLDVDKMDEYARLEEKKRELVYNIENLERYIHMIRDIERNAKDTFGMGFSGVDSCRQLLDCAGFMYEEKDVEVIRRFIGQNDMMNAVTAFSVSMVLGILDSVEGIGLHWNIQNFFIERFNRIYPDGLSVGMISGRKYVRLPLRTYAGFYNPTGQFVDVENNSPNVKFNPNKLFSTLKNFVEGLDYEIEAAFWAYGNVMKRNKERMTPFALLCLPQEINLDKIGVYSYLCKLVDLMFQNRQMITVRFKDLVHLLGYTTYPNENCLKYYKAEKFTEGLKRIGVCMVTDAVFIKDGNPVPKRDIPLDSTSVLWRKEENDTDIKKEWSGFFKDWKEIARYILDAGNDTEDRIFVEDFTDNIRPNRLKAYLKALFISYTKEPRKYNRKKWSDEKYRKEIRKGLKERLKTLEKKIARANKKIGILQ